MNIAMFSDTYLPQVNGVATSIYLMKRELEKMGHKVVIVAPVSPENDPSVLVVPGIPFLFEKQYRIAIPNILDILDFLEEHQIEIIHSHDPFSIGFRALKASEILDVPHVHTYHTLLVKYRHYIPPPLTPTETAVKTFSAWFCNKCDVVIAPTGAIKEELYSYGVNVPVHVVATGIDMDSFEKDDYDIRSKHNIPRNRKLLLFVGRVAKEKNVMFIVEMFEKLVKFLDAHLMIIGDGPLRSSVEEFVTKRRLADRVTLTGYMKRDELPNYYRQADLFVFASVTETQGLVVLESLAAGTPVVAVAKEGVADVLEDGEGCLLLNEVNMDEFIEKVLSILQDPALHRQLRSRARKYVEKNWSVEASARKLVKVYEEATRLKKERETPPMVYRLKDFAQAVMKVFGGRNDG